MAGADVIALPDVLEVLDDLRLVSRAPTCPLLVVHAVHDQVDDVDEQVQRDLNGGARVTYLRDRCSERVSLLPPSVSMAGLALSAAAGRDVSRST